MSNTKRKKIKELAKTITGDVYTNHIWRTIYATDGSEYREMPLAVVRPKNTEDIKKVIRFATENKTSIIPRAAGTSLAGQVVGSGVVVDISKYLTKIIEFNKEEKWVRVEPGVNLDELNQFLKPHGLLFGPETSTANRCLIAGMVGNNACGLHSLVYGSTRDHTLEIKAILSDGSDVVFKSISKDEFLSKCQGNSLENKIYSNIHSILSNNANQTEIRNEFPEKSLPRRNTGYAIDLLLETEVFTETNEKFNFCKLIAGSEGTLAFITEVKLNLVPLPLPVKGLICVHLKSVKDSLLSNLIALKFKPEAIELMDDKILELTKGNIEQRKNRFFIEGDPGALLIIEFAKNTQQEILAIKDQLEAAMKKEGFGFHFPVVFGADIKKVWDLRKAGLGVLSNMPGDSRPVSVIEDTSVSPDKLPAYIDEFNLLLEKHQLSCVYHAHIATGELHLRPILNLRDPVDVEKFRAIAEDTAKLVKKYKGSLSGEHGDGRLRGEFIPLMIGSKNYELLKSIKKCWDPNSIFNPGKIIDTPKMNSSLRLETGKEPRDIPTYFNFSSTQGILRASEKCNGSADCRKSHIIGGTMCPSYMATGDEDKTTRARANMLREILTHSKKHNPFDNKELYQIMSLCLSCKACKSECPSNVDVAKLKAEFLQHYYDANGIPLRSRLIANITQINALGSISPVIFNYFMSNKYISKAIMKIIGFAPQRQMPLLYKFTLKRWIQQHVDELCMKENPKGTIYLFIDEFTNYNDTEIGVDAIELLSKLGYRILIAKHNESGRASLSKGMLKKAKKIANQNIHFLKDLISEKTPLIGIEPSAILAFRDEYPELVDEVLVNDAKKIAMQSFMIDEFIAKEIDKGNITKELFTKENRKVLFHGHCQQKAIGSTAPTKKILSLPENYKVDEIPSGCCGMAGSFGYEKEHYELSIKVGEMVLFPWVREAAYDTIICAPGTSCRHQIIDATNREAKHPVTILREALIVG